jgi:adenylosuccinate lyase
MAASSANDYQEYLSPFSWRYGSPEMRHLWSEEHKRRLWRRIWVAIAEGQQKAGLVTAQQVEELRTHQDEVNVARSLEIEQDIRHDLMAEIKVYAEQCPLAGGIIHLGATSMDIEDNADILRILEGLQYIEASLHSLILAFAEQIEKWADTPSMAFTHLQPAEPTTIGYRLAIYAQDLIMDDQSLRQLKGAIRGKGLKGAVGTSASYCQLLEGTGMTAEELEQGVMADLGLPIVPVATQVYPRKQDYWLVSTLAGIGQSLYKFAFDLRFLQSPPIGEWSEPFGAQQVGSSAMPFKRNPINAENIDSLARQLAALPRIAWDNAAHNLLERTLDDSANRRSLLPEAFLITDELLRKGLGLIKGLRVDELAARRLVMAYGPFAATERLLMLAVKRGGDRQELHEVIRRHAMTAWEQISQGRPNPLEENLSREELLIRYLSPEEIHHSLDASTYLGNAPAKARQFAAMARREIES